MKTPNIAFILLIISALNSSAQDSIIGPDISIEPRRTEIVKEYFFDDRLQINDSTALVIIIEEAQTQMAADLGHRIYDDTAFIRMLKSRFYEEKEMINGMVEEEIHFCGHDMYFYSLSNGVLSYLNQLNSNCGLSEISCQDLDLLFESGRQLRVDTISKLSRRYKKSPDKLFTDRVIKSHYLNSHPWDICRSSKFPMFYYQGYFQTELTLDTLYTVQENIERFIRQYSVDFDNLNWNVSSYVSPIKKFKYLHQPTQLKLSVYLKKKVFMDFNEFDIIPIVPHVNKENRLLIYYDD